VLGHFPQQIIFFQTGGPPQILSLGSHLPSILQKLEDDIQWRYSFFEQQLAKILPDLNKHFLGIEFKSQFYLYEWLESLFMKVLPGEDECRGVLLRVWDIFFLKGEVFMYQCALGILKYLKPYLIGYSSEQCQKVFERMKLGAYGLKEDLGERLFQTIFSIPLSVGEFVQSKETQLVGQEKAHIFKIYE